jgi:hypothetical protein
MNQFRFGHNSSASKKDVCLDDLMLVRDEIEIESPLSPINNEQVQAIKA